MGEIVFQIYGCNLDSKAPLLLFSPLSLCSGIICKSLTLKNWGY